ncbi:MAG TPA: MtrB/PioB family decaheme-associated outer membrane protein [Steroidobacteraceae bacterium]|nr:MtrB/PioB family decaheme-associated outer membrane protein [Steroidobacteraceae bacterium]
MAAVAAAIAGALAVPTARADDPPPPDTSAWKCEQCPFSQGYTASGDVGAIYADGANAASGHYTGMDHAGTYIDADAQGAWRDSAGAFVNYDLQNLGLPDRDGFIQAGQAGQYSVAVAYDGQPTRVFDDTVSPFRSIATGQLALPSNWVAASTTGAMTQLGSSLAPAKIEFDRRTVSLLGQYFLASSWTLYADFRHQEKEGTGLTSAAFLTEAVQLPVPIDYVTDAFDVGANWAGRLASLRIVYTGSWFKDDTDSLSFANPFLPIVPGSTQGLLSLPPGNELQQVAASGDLRLPLFQATTLTYGFSYGWLGQDATLLPVSSLPGASMLGQSSLLGEVRLPHYNVALSSRPLSRLYVRGSANYDARIDDVQTLAIPYIVTDTYPGGTALTPRYGEERTRLAGSADYRFFSWLRAGVAGQFLDIHYSPGQVLTWMNDRRSWGYFTVTPDSTFSLSLKIGNGDRKVSGLNTAAEPPTENPYLVPYDYAPRDRNFYSLLASWSMTATLTYTAQGGWIDDAYRLSGLGLQEVRERDLSNTLTWIPTEKVSMYVDSDYQRIASAQNGSIGAGAPSWYLTDSDWFWTVGAGGKWSFRDRWDLGVDYVHAPSRDDDSILSGGASTADDFPENRTKLDSLWANLTYHWTKALNVRLRFGHERYDSSDWALDGVGPATIPTVLSMGEQPYRYRVNIVQLSAQYRLD